MHVSLPQLTSRRSRMKLAQSGKACDEIERLTEELKLVNDKHALEMEDLRRQLVGNHTTNH